ncbi:jg20258 [Pararge aegeria aegeria]|uniref:Jg20258 protein n=1 Tax=Pararge aegeria aegeria TaxID=348720 RepID=A0A8S4R292_9NEOP|nr:jg20258 [Pararge aegeria aegeria]
MFCFVILDNQLQWLPQRPVYNYHHCELRFWRNRSLGTIPYSLWYHMFRGQQTRSLNIGCFGNLLGDDTSNKDTIVLRLGPNNKELKMREINFPRKYEHILNKELTAPSLMELCKRKFYQILDNASKRLTTSPTISIYSDVNYDDTTENNNNIGNLQDYFKEFNLNNGFGSRRNINEEYYEKCKGDTKVDKLFIKTKMKGYCVPFDIVEEHFYYFPKFLKDELCNGPMSRCENVSCKKALFDYVYLEFCLEKITLIENTEDVILNANFCSKYCAEVWKTGKDLLSWEFL